MEDDKILWPKSFSDEFVKHDFAKYPSLHAFVSDLRLAGIQKCDPILSAIFHIYRQGGEIPYNFYHRNVNNKQPLTRIGIFPDNWTERDLVLLKELGLVVSSTGVSGTWARAFSLMLTEKGRVIAREFHQFILSLPQITKGLDKAFENYQYCRPLSIIVVGNQHSLDGSVTFGKKLRSYAPIISRLDSNLSMTEAERINKHLSDVVNMPPLDRLICRAIVSFVEVKKEQAEILAELGNDMMMCLGIGPHFSLKSAAENPYNPSIDDASSSIYIPPAGVIEILKRTGIPSFSKKLIDEIALHVAFDVIGHAPTAHDARWSFDKMRSSFRIELNAFKEVLDAFEARGITSRYLSDNSSAPFLILDWKSFFELTRSKESAIWSNVKNSGL